MNWNDVVRYAREGNLQPPRRVERSEDEWRALLAEDRFYVTRLKGTERPHSSEMCSLFSPGRYVCGSCKTELFDSRSKFDSRSGWPSFTEPVDPSAVAYHMDTSHGMQRVETTCSVCDAHLGHVFPDGPQPSGLRFCINALALDKLAEAEG